MDAGGKGGNKGWERGRDEVLERVGKGRKNSEN